MLFYCDLCEVEVDVDLEAERGEQRCPKCLRKSTLVDAVAHRRASARAIAEDRPPMGTQLALIGVSVLITGGALALGFVCEEHLGAVFAPVMFGIGVAGYGAIRFASRAGDDPAETGPWTPARVVQVYAIRLGVCGAAGASVMVAGVIARLVVGPDAFFTTLGVGALIWLGAVLVVGIVVGRVIRSRKP